MGGTPTANLLCFEGAIDTFDKNQTKSNWILYYTTEPPGRLTDPTKSSAWGFPGAVYNVSCFVAKIHRVRVWVCGWWVAGCAEEC